ncbi:exopolysaccharide biosynthesis polyprenyl glycosylphosphotransferase [Sphingobacterium psychroaquaticum]|nr:exopolysaccharide biosynthesis polyprenyl glycosylphosphotransferase [Sphingobacterium psychroaquaticum]
MDLLCINIALQFALSVSTYNGWISLWNGIPISLPVVSTLFSLIWFVAAQFFHLYREDVVGRLESMFRATLRTALITLGAVLIFAIFNGPLLASVKAFGVLVLFLSIYLLVSRMFMTYVYTTLPRRFNWVKKVAVIGAGNQIAPVASFFDQQQLFYQVDTIQYKDEDAAMTKEETLRKFKQYFEAVSKDGIHDVFLVTSPEMYKYSEDLVSAADHQCVHLNFVPSMVANITYKEGAPAEINLPVLKSRGESMSNIENRLKKRFMDTVISGFVIVFVLSWLIPIIGLIIKIQSPGPIFFKQLRSGRNNTPFYCYKFRSMVVNKSSNDKQATKNDSRITPIGKFLRKSNLDEFPQFINVFLGQMSIVGPRPHMLSHTEHYGALINRYMVRHFVKPGITGWAQVSGYRGETKDPMLMAKRVEHDLEYMQNWSAMLDFKIICLTAINMIRGEKNAY